MDTRLFKNEQLYCEGLHKPVYRGYIHLFSLFLFPVGLCFLYNGITSPYAFKFSTVNLITNFICFVTSSIYHIGNWSVKTEIILQKLDHINISIWCVGMVVPVSFLLFPYNVGIPLLCLCSSAFIGNCYFIYLSKPSMLLSSAVPATILLYVDSCALYMNNVEWVSMWCIFGFQLIGMLFFELKLSPSFFNADMFGYHEIFHTISILVSICVFIFVFSIAARYEDPVNYNLIK
jgi:hemolysin III